MGVVIYICIYICLFFFRLEKSQVIVTGGIEYLSDAFVNGTELLVFEQSMI